MTRGAFAGFALATLLVVAALPVNEWLESVRGWIAGLGFWAPAAYAATYGLATTIFIPASALSLAAGVLFGVWKGSAIVWIGANLATVASFLIARFAARSRVEAMAQARPRFAAVDRALGEEGWKIVALMRLSPVFPFTLQNYLFGVTAVRFWPYTIASAVCMVPGTFLYVYVGYAGGQAAAAASGAPGTEALRLGLQAVGVLATILVTVFVTRIASRAVARHAPERSAELPPQKTRRESRVPPGRPVRLFGLAAAALVAASIAFLQRDAIRAHFYPPRVQIIERYAGDTGTATFDHGGLDRLLAEHVDPEGLVDYAALADDSEALAAYISAVGSAPFEQLGRDEKLAMLINAYNAFTLQLVVEHYPVDSIRSIPEPQRWEAERWSVAGGLYSLNQIENFLIRPNFQDDRIHFALVCAAIGCPKLRMEAYSGATIERQLQTQAEEIHASPRWFEFDRSTGLAALTQVYSWYAGDFEQIHGSVLAAAARYSPEFARATERGEVRGIRWLPYDWALNERHEHTSEFKSQLGSGLH